MSITKRYSVYISVPASAPCGSQLSTMLCRPAKTKSQGLAMDIFPSTYSILPLL